MELINRATKLFLKNPRLKKFHLNFDVTRHSITHLMPAYGNDLDIEQLVSRLSQRGFSQHLATWLSDEKNLPLNARQAVTLFGEKPVRQFASLLRIAPEIAADSLAKMVPLLIDHQSNNGVLYSRLYHRSSLIRTIGKYIGAA